MRRPRCAIAIVQVCLTCNASNHHGPHKQKSRPLPPDEIEKMADVGARSGQDVLVQNKEWLDSLNLSLRIPQGEIQISEFRVQGIGHYFVVAMIFML